MSAIKDLDGGGGELADLKDSKPQELKLVVVGDGYIGKTSLLWSYVYRKFPVGYVPTIFDIHAGE